MRYALAALLALGCNPTAEPPRGLYLDAGADVPTAVDVQADRPDRWIADAPAECLDPYIRCDDGSCLLQNDQNCGACGRQCINDTGC